MSNSRERTEQKARPGLDEGSKYKGIARHPFARRWLQKVYAEARTKGKKGFAAKTRKYMKQMGMETRNED